MEIIHCRSCAAPLTLPDFRGAADDYCKFCTDDNGKVKSREQVRAGIIQWMKMWCPPADDAAFEARADHYMKAMPHWAE